MCKDFLLKNPGLWQCQETAQQSVSVAESPEALPEKLNEFIDAQRPVLFSQFLKRPAQQRLTSSPLAMGLDRHAPDGPVHPFTVLDTYLMIIDNKLLTNDNSMGYSDAR